MALVHKDIFFFYINLIRKPVIIACKTSLFLMFYQATSTPTIQSPVAFFLPFDLSVIFVPPLYVAWVDAKICGVESLHGALKHYGLHSTRWQSTIWSANSCMYDIKHVYTRSCGWGKLKLVDTRKLVTSRQFHFHTFKTTNTCKVHHWFTNYSSPKTSLES